MTATEELRQLVVIKIDQAVKNGTPVTAEQIRAWAERFLPVIDSEPTTAEVEQMARELEADFNVHIGGWNSLSDDGDHVPWLTGDRLDKADWQFWNRYHRYLRTEAGLPSAAVRRLDEITDDVLGRLEDPGRAGAWDRRGLVAGQVQSGKTGNYIGLIAKAIDNGYKLVVVLAGVHNSLRSQTQARIDEGILGFDTRAIRKASQAGEGSRIGVGKLAGPWLHVNSFTSSLSNGDFRLTVAQGMGIAPGGGDPIILVVKKNKSILENLFEWSTHLKKEKNPDTGKYKVRGVPVLLIDDEADHASVNTAANVAGEDEADPSVINGLIRKFLDAFEQTAYVAYTATPFANIFIDPEADHSATGKDLFPRSFIVNLPVPSTYIGPERVFGLSGSSQLGIEAVKPLDIVRDVTDAEAWMPDRHKASHVPDGPLPPSLVDAVVLFLAAGAVRRARGQLGKHHSMLVHVTRFTNVQAIVAEQVKALLDDMRTRLDFGEGANPWLYDQIARLYTHDMVPTSQQLASEPDLADQVGKLPSLDELVMLMAEVARETRIHLVNGKSSDALEYVDHPDGISVIAIGGDKLSRGLTLEGLTVSYYLRASRMYDTLMQMGRWFGYRPGYLDVCRLFTPPPLVRWYERITAATAELQSEFEAMAAVGGTPEDFGLRVVQLPDGLLVTSPAKLRSAQKYSISFSGTISETVTFSRPAVPQNFVALENLVSSLDPGRAEGTAGLKAWRSVPPEVILEFLDSYMADRAAFKSRPKALAEYIRARNTDDELTSWTVALADVGRTGQRQHLIGGSEIGLTLRNPHPNVPVTADRYTLRRLVSPSHELVSLVRGSARWANALDYTVEAWTNNPKRKADSSPPSRPSPLFERLTRGEDEGLLILYPLDPAPWATEAGVVVDVPIVGYAVSFPRSETAVPIEYQVNPVFLRNVFGWDESEDD